MDVSSAATQLIGFLGDNPDLISQFVNHPYSTTAQAMGTDETISKEDMSQIVTQAAAQSTNQSLGSTDTANIASMLLGASGGSVHSLASSLFGGGASTSASSTDTAQAGGLGGMVDLGGLLGSLLGGGSGSGAAPSTGDILAKSLAGGIAARGMASLVTSALGTNDTGKKTDKESAKQQAAAPDFSMLADLAKTFLK